MTEAGAVRGTLLAVCAVALGLAAHGGAGGAVPAPSPWLVLVALAVGCSAAVRMRGTRRLGVARSIATLGAGQLALHLALAAGDHAHAGAPADAMAGMPGMGGTAGAASTTATLAMIAAHAVATLVVAALVAGADRAVVSTVRAASARWARDVVALLRPLPVTAGPAPATPTEAAPRVVASTVLRRRVHPRRGPPLLAV